MSDDVRIIKEGGYQGTRDPGFPSEMLQPQIVPVQVVHGESGGAASPPSSPASGATTSSGDGDS